METKFLIERGIFILSSSAYRGDCGSSADLLISLYDRVVKLRSQHSLSYRGGLCPAVGTLQIDYVGMLYITYILPVQPKLSYKLVSYPQNSSHRGNARNFKNVQRLTLVSFCKKNVNFITYWQVLFNAHLGIKFFFKFIKQKQ